MALHYAPDADDVDFDLNDAYAYVPRWNLVSFNFGAVVIVNPEPEPEPEPETPEEESNVPLPAAGKAQVAWTSGHSFVKLNPLEDTLDLPAHNAAIDEVFAITVQATRGRVDKPFYVTRESFTRLVGNYANDKAWIALYEGINNGARGAVVSRIAHNPVERWATLSRAGVWATPTATYADTRDFDYPTTALAILHRECFDEGVMFSLHADAAAEVTNEPLDSFVTLLVRDIDGNVLFQFHGSLDWSARDQEGNSAFLPDVVSRQTDLVKVIANVDMDATAGLPILPMTDHIGCDTYGNKRWYTTPLLILFTRATIDPVPTSAYTRAVQGLRDTLLPYGYLSGGGTESVNLLRLLFALAGERNAQMRFDVPGDLTVTEAVDYMAELGADQYESSHLIHAYWAPLRSHDPTGILGVDYYGMATLNIAYACARNRSQGVGGFATKNFPIAGREWPINRVRLQQTLHPNEQALNMLARAHINPVLHEQYTGGGRYVFRDAITCANADVSLKRLIAVVEMSCAIDDTITRVGQDILHLPLQLAKKRMGEFLTGLFKGADKAGWLTLSEAPEMRGRSWQFEVNTLPERPYDALKVSYWLHYDGTARQMYVTQTIVKNGTGTANTQPNSSQ